MPCKIARVICYIKQDTGVISWFDDDVDDTSPMSSAGGVFYTGQFGKMAMMTISVTKTFATMTMSRAETLVMMGTRSGFLALLFVCPTTIT